MQTEYFWRWVERKRLDVVKVVLFVADRWGVVNSTLRHGMPILEHIGIKITAQNGLDESDIDVVSDSTTVVDFGANLVEYLVWDFFVVLDEDLQLFATNIQVFIGERVQDVPANWSELSAILHDGMEEAQSKEEFLEVLWLCASLELFFSHCLVC